MAARSCPWPSFDRPESYSCEMVIACVEFGRLGCACIICDRSSCLLVQALAVEPKRQDSLPHLVSGVVLVCGVARLLWQMSRSLRRVTVGIRPGPPWRRQPIWTGELASTSSMRPDCGSRAWSIGVGAWRFNMSHLIFRGLWSVTGRYPLPWSQPVSIRRSCHRCQSRRGGFQWPVVGAFTRAECLVSAACPPWRLGHGCSKTAADLRSMRRGRFGRASGCQTWSPSRTYSESGWPGVTGQGFS